MPVTIGSPLTQPQTPRIRGVALPADGVLCADQQEILDSFPVVRRAMGWARICLLGAATTFGTPELRSAVARVAEATAKGFAGYRLIVAGRDPTQGLAGQRSALGIAHLAHCVRLLRDLAWWMQASHGSAPFADALSGGATMRLSAGAFAALAQLEAWDPVRSQLEVGQDLPPFALDDVLTRLFDGITFTFPNRTTVARVPKRPAAL